MLLISNLLSLGIHAFLFLYSHTVLIVGTLMASSGLAFLISYYLYGYSSTPHSRSSSSSDSPTRSVRRVRSLIIHESDEDPPTSTKTAKSDVVELRRMRKRDWAKKLYKSLLADSHDRHSSDESNSSQEKNVRPRFLKRRHSTSGPLQIAKDLIRRGSRNYFRHTTEMRDKLPRPPQEYYEPTDLPQIPQNLQPELFYVLHNLKMLELPAEWKLDPRDIEVRSYASGDVILHPGDPDDSIYVAINGTLNVYIAHKEEKDYLVKKILPGNSFYSFLSLLDVMMSAPSFFKSVSLKAAEPCTVAKFPVRSFRESYNRYPEAWMRPIQIILTRLHHVTMTTLHQYMGLSAELMKRRCDVGLEDRTYHHINGPSRPVPGLALSHKKAKELRISSTDGDTAEQITIARKWFAEALGMQENDGSLIEKIGGINIRSFEEGDLLVEQGSQEEQLILVLSGSLKLSQEPVFDEETQDEDDDNTISRLFPRDLFGGLQLLTNEPSFYTVRAVCKSTVAIMEKIEFNRLLNAHPHIYLPIAHSVLRRLSPFLRAVDFSLDWVLVDTGMAVYREGDSADSMYVMLSGRLRSVEKKTLVEEFGRGDMLGMMEVLQKKPRATTVLAVRFSQLARIPEGLLNFIKLQFPQVGFRLVQLLGQYYSSLHRRIPYPPTTTIEGPGDPINHIKNLHTIAVVPASAEVPLIPFTCELYHALSSNLKVLRLSSQKVATHLDSTVLEKQADFRLMHWLNVQEDTYPLVIYECDYTATNWTRRCLRQADAILVVAMGNKKPHTQTLMRELLSTNQDGARTNKELVLLWPEKTLSPSGTHEWLKDTYYSGHHHIRAPKRMFQWLSRKTRKSSKEIVHLVGEHEVVEYYEKNVFWTVDFRSDFARIARILTGNAIGLALGGGGARGAAHVGVIRALRERGIPIDIVGGTSIGALVAAVYASTPDENVEERTSRWFDGMTSLWRKLLDLTYAHSAMFTGAQLNKSLQSVFEETEIENLWIPYFCISTDITTSEMRVHRSGPLWAYCRASMSLAGYLPPMCDPQDGHLLLDGGYVNNLPADVMKSMGAKCVIAVDVGSSEETNLYNYGDSLSGIWVLLNRLNPWAKSIRILNMEEIQTRLAYVSCVRQLEIVKKAAYCSYFRPPIEPFKTLEFNKFDEILEIGYEYGKKKVEELMESQAFNSLLIGDTSYNLLHRQFNSRRPLHIERSTSFTDLAAALSKIPTVRPMVRHSLSAYDQTEDVFDDIDFLNHSDADNELSQSDFNDASEVEIGPDRQSSCTPRP